jgi:acetyl-CoA synthetase
VVFVGYSAESLVGCILDCQLEVILSCSRVQRGNKLLPLKKIVDDAFQFCVHQRNFRLGIPSFCLSQAKLLL